MDDRDTWLAGAIDRVTLTLRVAFTVLSIALDKNRFGMTRRDKARALRIRRLEAAMADSAVKSVARMHTNLDQSVSLLEQSIRKLEGMAL